jgi:hypothetical protein
MKTRIVLATFAAVVIGAAAILSLNRKAPERSAQDIATIKELTERIKRLEQALAAKEKPTVQTDRAKQGQVAEATFSPDGKEVLTRNGKTVRLWEVQSGTVLTNSVPSPNLDFFLQRPETPARVPPAKPSVPPGWQTREFNGMTYYMVPLAQAPQGALKP